MGSSVVLSGGFQSRLIIPIYAGCSNAIREKREKIDKSIYANESSILLLVDAVVALWRSPP